MNDMHLKKCFALALVMMAGLLVDSRGARAGFIVMIPHVTVAPGGSGYLDVLISSSGTDSFQSYLLDFVVSGGAQAADPINFVGSSILAPQLTATNPAYVFLDNSQEMEADEPFGIDFVTNASGLLGPDDAITVIDSTFDSQDRTIAVADGNFLLARLNFVAPLSATVGNVYDVSLDFGEFLDGESLWEDEPESLPFTANVGSITIGVTAVPEPSSMSLTALGCLAWLVAKHRRKRCVVPV